MCQSFNIMTTYRFIFTIIDAEGEIQPDNIPFEADDEQHAAELVQAFAKLRLGNIHNPERIHIEVGKDNRIFGVTIGENILQSTIPVLAGDIYLDADVKAEAKKRESEEVTKATALKNLNVPTV